MLHLSKIEITEKFMTNVANMIRFVNTIVFENNVIN